LYIEKLNIHIKHIVKGMIVTVISIIFKVIEPNLSHKALKSRYFPGVAQI